MAFKNAQWKVTDFGIERVGKTVPYEIPAKNLAEIRNDHGGPLYDWPIHMAEKRWVDINLFIEAFKAALDFHKARYSPAVNPTMLEASCAEARKDAARNR
jgi:hypothetical protein